MTKGIDHIGIAVVSIVHDGKGNIALVKRSKNARDEHGKWDICGGALELHEFILDAIKREIKEEFTAKALHIQFLHAGEAHRMNDAGEKTHWIWLLHAVLVDPKEVSIGEPHKFDELGWFNTTNLPKPLHSQFPHALKWAKHAGIIN